MQEDFDSEIASFLDMPLEQIAARLSRRMEQDELIQNTTQRLRETLQVDRVVMYYFYRPWKGQVTFESLSAKHLSILGSTGADDCFNDEYAQMYLQGRIRAIADIELEPIHKCHKDFLRSIRVRANLVVPVLVNQRLWGLLIAHHTQSPHLWSANDIELMLKAAQDLANSPTLQN